MFSAKRSQEKYRYLIYFVALLFIISIYFYFSTNKYRQVYLFYPDKNLATNVESVYIPNSSNLEHLIYHVVLEIITGPRSVPIISYIPNSVRINSCILRGGKVYLDFSSEIFLENIEREFPLEERFALMERNITHNFPRVKELIVTIDANEPFKWPFPAKFSS